MNTYVRVIVIVGVLLAAGGVAGNEITRADQIPQLKKKVQQKTVIQRIKARFIHSHYCRFDLDALFIARIFDRYINMLDCSHNVFLASDIEQFLAKKSQLADELKSGKLELPFIMYQLMEQRQFERYRYALAKLKRPMDFNGNGSIEIDRSKAPWVKTIAELNALWDAKVKSEELNLKLSGKGYNEIRAILIKRYQFAMRRLTQNNSEDVFQLIMNAFAHEIDPHTNYLSPRIAAQFNTEINLLLEGIGAVLHMDDDFIIINSLVSIGPAAKSKAISVGDRVVGVGQSGKPMVDVIGWRLDDVVSLIQGPEGSKVCLEMFPAGKGSMRRIVTVTRKRVRLEDRALKMSVRTIGTQKVGVLNIPSFYIGLTNDVKAHLKKLKKQGVLSVIIDLRANGGGSLTEAISVSRLFISSGPIVQFRDKKGRIHENSNYNGILSYKGPLVVLVDRFSASASEIFAAAMQDYGRALVVGESTFGKGTVQQYRSLRRIYDQILHPEWPSLGSIQYTIKKFYRVNGDSTQYKGVVPDIIMPTNNKTLEIGEKFEKNALPWDSINAAIYSKIGDLNPYFAKLRKVHQVRIANNPEFQYIVQDIMRFHNVKDKSKVLSLNLAQREKENHEMDAIRLQRINERLVSQGKEVVKNLESIPKDYKEPDPFLDETVHIALDLVYAEAKEPGVSLG